MATTSQKSARERETSSVASPSDLMLNPSEKLCWLIVGGLTLLAAILRFWKLGHASLWGDEINFVLHSSYPTFGEYIDRYELNFMDPTFPPHLPFATVLEFIFTRFGTNEFWGR